MPKKVALFDNGTLYVNKPDIELPAAFKALRGLVKVDAQSGQYEVLAGQEQRWNELHSVLAAQILPLRSNSAFMPFKEFLSTLKSNADNSLLLWDPEESIEEWLKFLDDEGINRRIILFLNAKAMAAMSAAVTEREPYLWHVGIVDHFVWELPGRGWSRGFYLFGNYFWQISDKERLLPKENLSLVFQDTVRRERHKMERLRRRHGDKHSKADCASREVIPEDVRVFVWRRDQGRCTKCGGQERLEFDHIIPVSKGGSNTARNIQILCERCNREKGDSI